MSIYLDDFRKKIESAHDFTTCHWTTIDKFGSQAKGPCTCPAAEPCLEHNMVNCENTLAVLGKSTAAEVTYRHQLDELEKRVRQIEDIVRQAKDMIHNLTHPSVSGMHSLRVTLSDLLLPQTKRKIIIATPMNQKNVDYESEVFVKFYNRLLDRLGVIIIAMCFFGDILGKGAVLKNQRI